MNSTGAEPSRRRFLAWAGVGAAALVGARRGDVFMAPTMGNPLELDDERPSLNVKHFGAVGDGVVDDTGAIQATLHAVPESGARICFPPGIYRVSVNPITGSVLTLARTNVLMHGAGASASVIRLASGAGDYTAMLTSHTATRDLRGLRVEDLAFDQNSAGNPIIYAGPGSPLFTGKPRFVVLWSGSTLDVVRCRFTGTDNVNTIYASATPSGAVNILDCVFDGVGAHSPMHDHSSLYVCNGAYMRVQGNKFLGAGPSAVTAIETHGSQQFVSGNVVEAYQRIANITGISKSGARDVLVSDNVGRGLASGIVLWSRPYEGDRSGLVDCHVVGNEIDIALDAWSSVVGHKTGIALDPGTTLGMRDISIRSNVIRYQMFTTVPSSVDQLSAGIQWYRSVATADSDVNIDISDNLVDGAPTCGIYLYPNASAIENLGVHRNVVVDPVTGNSPHINSGYKVGMLVGGVLRNARLDANTVMDRRSPHVINSAIDAQTMSGNSSAVEMSDNQVQVADGRPPAVVSTGAAYKPNVRRSVAKHISRSAPPRP